MRRRRRSTRRTHRGGWSALGIVREAQPCREHPLGSGPGAARCRKRGLMAALRRTVTAAEEARLADGSVETWTTSAERSEVEAILATAARTIPWPHGHVWQPSTRAPSWRTWAVVGASRGTSCSRSGASPRDVAVRRSLRGLRGQVCPPISRCDGSVLTARSRAAPSRRPAESDLTRGVSGEADHASHRRAAAGTSWPALLAGLMPAQDGANTGQGALRPAFRLCVPGAARGGEGDPPPGGTV